MLTFAATFLAYGLAAIPAHSSLTSPALQKDALVRARLIRADVTTRYRHVVHRKLAVTEATSTGVVESITLVTDWLEPSRVVSADNGIYFAICPARAKCPYPARSLAWPAEAPRPRRMALELAVRTFAETSVRLVIVALPTIRPVWIVFERDDLEATMDAPAVVDKLRSNPALIDPSLRELVNRLTRRLTYAPLLILPPPDDTIYAVRLFTD